MRLIIPYRTYDYYGEPFDLEYDEDDRKEDLSDGLFLYKVIEAGTVVMGLEPSAIPLVDVLVIPPEIDGAPVVGLGFHAFFNEDSIAKIVIPETVVAIGWQALAGTREVEVATNNPRFSSQSGALFDKNKTVLIHFPIDAKFKTNALPQTVKIIGDSAFFQCKNLTRIVLPNGIERIDDHAFEDCDSLKNVALPESLKIIGEEVFHFPLKQIALPKGVQEIGADAFPNDITTIKVDAENEYFRVESHALFNKDKSKLVFFFPGKDDVPTYFVPHTVKTIGSMAFQGRNALKKIVLPQGLETIEDSAFFDCDSLTCVKLPEGVKTIDRHAFGSCGKLARVELPESLETIGDYAFHDCFKLKEIVIPNGVQKIGECAFQYAGLKKGVVNIPASVREIGTNAFLFPDVPLVVDPASEYFVSESGALFNKEKTRLLQYDHNSDAKTLVLPETLKEIDELIFWWERNLDKIILPASVEKIGNKAFLGTGADIEVSDDNPYYASESGALFNKDKTKLIHFPTKSKLETYVIPDSVHIIEADAFYECRNLKRIVIPPSVREIGVYAFHEVEATFEVYKGTLGEQLALLCKLDYEILE